MEVVVERPGALDVHKASVTACVRVPAEGGRREEHIAQFATTVQGLLALRDWLAAHHVTQVTMEATGVYWKPVWAILEDDFELILVNARHVKQVPGRKTDVSDAAWLCRLAEAGLLRASLVPPKAIRDLRDLTRYRKAQIRDRQREANRLHKVMQDTGIKLDSVASDLLGKSGRAMLDALVTGTTDPEVLADLARGQLRKKLPALREALEGRFGAKHALIVGQILAHMDFLDEAIDRLSAAIEEQLGPFGQAQVELLCTIPGIQRRAAEVIIAETGADMTKFPTAGHLASWAGVCPGNDQSAGKRRSGRTTKGSKWLRQTLTESAKAAARTKDTYLAAQYARIRVRRGANRATTAVAHSILTAAWHMLQTGQTYADPGGDYFQRRDPQRATKRLVAQLERLGHTVTLEEAEVAA
ncbi:MAG: IS110 family transposase [Solirubrobacteraceae bacterium MAG38_C4-C5]|nr:IS110 family transposase [Candidatus Siliceabacter maunaloa]